MSKAIINQPRAQHHLSRIKLIPAQRLSITPVGNPTVRDPTNTLVDRLKGSGKGFDEEWRRFLVLLNFGVLNIKEQKVHHPEELETIPIKKARRRQLVCKVPLVQGAPTRVQDTDTRASGKRTLSKGVEATKGTPQNVSFAYSVSN